MLNTNSSVGITSRKHTRSKSDDIDDVSSAPSLPRFMQDQILEVHPDSQWATNLIEILKLKSSRWSKNRNLVRNAAIIVLIFVFGVLLYRNSPITVAERTYWTRSDDRFNHFLNPELERRGFVRVRNPSESVHYLYCYSDYPYLTVLEKMAPMENYANDIPPIRHMIRSRISETLTLKSQLSTTLTNYVRENNLPESTIDFLPKTWKLGDPYEKLEFLQSLPCETDSEKMWIFKKAHSAGGKNMFLERDPVKIKKTFHTPLTQKREQCDGYHNELRRRTSTDVEFSSGEDTIAQEYIITPLLIDGRKFHVRAYWLLASLDPVLLLYFDSYIMKAIGKFNARSTKIEEHITNNSVTEKSNLTVVDTHMNMEQLDEYIDETYSKKDFYTTEYMPQIKKIGEVSARILDKEYTAAANPKTAGKYQFLATDMVVTADYKVKLIEWQRSPGMVAMVNNCDVLPWGCEFGRTMAKEQLDVVFQINENGLGKTCINRLVLNEKLKTMRYQKIYDACDFRKEQ